MIPLRALVAIGALTGAFLLVLNAASAHDIYTNWKKPGTAISCCDDRDCYPVEAKFEEGRWLAQRREDGRWLVVPPEVVLTDFATPDGQAHLCAPPPLSSEDERVYCFRPPWSGN